MQTVMNVELAPGTYVLVVEGHRSAEGLFEVLMTCLPPYDNSSLTATTKGGCTCRETWAVASSTCTP